MRDFVKEQTKRLYKLRLACFIPLVVIFALILGLMLFGNGNIWTVTEITDASRLSTLYRNGTKLVTITADVYDTGYYTASDEGVIDRAYIIITENQYVLVRVPKSWTEEAYTAKKLTGVLDKFTDIEDEIYYEVINDYADYYGLDTSEVRAYFSTVILSVKSGDLWTPRAFEIIFALLIIILIVLLIKAASDKAHPEKTKYYKQLALAGEDSRLVNDAVSGELERGELVLKGKHMSVTENYLLITPGGRYNVVKLEDIVWLYRRVVKNSYNFVPVSKTYYIEVWTKDVRHYSVYTEGKAIFMKDRDNTLDQLASRCPNAVIGYYGELLPLVKNQQEFLKEYERIFALQQSGNANPEA